MMFSDHVIKKIIWYLQIVLYATLLAGAITLAFMGIPLLLIFLSHYFSEVRVGQWMVAGGLTLAVATLVYIVIKKR
jgi:hypothetical protein